MAGLIPPVFAELRATNAEFLAKVDESKVALGKLETEGSGSLQKLSAVGGGALAALGVVAVGASVIGIKAAMDYQQAHARLVTSIQNSGGTWAAERDSVEQTDRKMQGLAFTHAETESALARLLPVTHNMAKAQSDVALAADVARFKHIDLASATQLLSGIELGRMRGLVQLGISQKDATGATLTSAEAIQKVSEVVHGSATAYTHTFAGEIKGLEVNAEELAAQLGEVLIPIIEDVAHVAGDVFGFFVQHRAVTVALASAVGVVLVPAMALFVAQRVDHYLETVFGAWQKLSGTIQSGVSWVVAHTTASEADTVVLAENTVAQEANNLAAGGSVEAQGAATVAAEAHTLALGEQMTMLAADGTALEMGSGQLALFGAAGSAGAEGADAMTVAAGGMVAPLGAVAVGAAALFAAGYGLHKLLGEDLTAGFRQGATDARNFAQGLEHDVAGASSYQQAMAIAKNRLSELRQEQSTIVETTKRQGGGFEEASAKAVYYRDSIKSARDEIDKIQASHKADVEQTKAVAQVYGLTLPQAVAAGGKEAQNAIKLSEQVFGDAATKMAYAAAGPDDTSISGALIAAGKESQKFGKTVEQSVTAATDPFSKFKSATSVSEQSMEQFFVGSQQKAADWATEIKGLMEQGVDKGIVQEMAKAGPDSKPALDAFAEMVRLNGVQWVNDQQHASDAAVEALKSGFSQEEVAAVTHGAEMSTLQDAYTKDMKNHTDTNLRGLLDSTDENLRKAAYSALMNGLQVGDFVDTGTKRAKELGTSHMGQLGGAMSQSVADSAHAIGGSAIDITNAVNGIPFAHSITITAIDDATAVISGVAQAAQSIPQQVNTQLKGWLTSAHGSVALAHGGVTALAGGGVGDSKIVGPNQPVLIGEGLSREAVVPLDNFNDMTATIRASGKAGAFAQAARLAAGDQDTPARMLWDVSEHRPAAAPSTRTKQADEHVHYHYHDNRTITLPPGSRRQHAQELMDMMAEAQNMGANTPWVKRT